MRVLVVFALLCVSNWWGMATETADPTGPQSLSVLAFAPDGRLLIGDSKAGAVWSYGLKGTPRADLPNLSVPDIEAILGQRIGVPKGDLLIHDMAVDPQTGDVLFAVSRGRDNWNSRWQLPNDVADSTILLKLQGGDSAIEVELGQPLGRMTLSNPVSAEKSYPNWKGGGSQRADAITDLACAHGRLFVTGLSNEEFASTVWTAPYPLKDEVTATTLEVFHGAHGKYETHAPIRTFLPYKIKGESHLLAAYLCTPFVSFKTADLKPGAHVRGRTIAEFGSGNYPLDMVLVEIGEDQTIFIANSQLPMMMVDPKDIASFEGKIVESPKTYTAGVPYEYRSGAGIVQLANYDDDGLLILQRMPSGKLELRTLRYRAE